MRDHRIGSRRAAEVPRRALRSSPRRPPRLRWSPDPRAGKTRPVFPRSGKTRPVFPRAGRSRRVRSSARARTAPLPRRPQRGRRRARTMPDAKSPKAREIALARVGAALAIAGAGRGAGKNPARERNPPSREGNPWRRRDLPSPTAAPRRNESRGRNALKAGPVPRGESAPSAGIDRNDSIVGTGLGVGRRPSDRAVPVAVPSVPGARCPPPEKAGRRARTAGGHRRGTEIGLPKVSDRNPLRIVAAKGARAGGLGETVARGARPRFQAGALRKAVAATGGRSAPVLHP